MIEVVGCMIIIFYLAVLMQFAYNCIKNKPPPPYSDQEDLPPYTPMVVITT